jgi:hypothetical protein
MLIGISGTLALVALASVLAREGLVYSTGMALRSRVSSVRSRSTPFS